MKIIMKKTITKMFAVAGIVAGTVLSVNAQVSKGSMMFGGSLGANITMESTTKVTGAADVKVAGHTDWNFSPTGGYFIADGLAVGLALNVGSSFMKTVTTLDGKTNENVSMSTMGFGLFARKYMEVTDKVYLHGQAGLGYASGSATDRVTDGADKLKDGAKISSSSMVFDITPGITYFVAPNWGIDFSLNNIIGYSSTTSKTETPAAGLIAASTTETTGGTFNIGAGLTPSLGLFYYMGK
jgi:outer membrane protein